VVFLPHPEKTGVSRDCRVTSRNLQVIRLSPNSPKLFLNNPKSGAFGDRALQPIVHPAERLGTVPYSLIARCCLSLAFGQ